jgi:hypothetical protein
MAKKARRPPPERIVEEQHKEVHEYGVMRRTFERVELQDQKRTRVTVEPLGSRNLLDPTIDATLQRVLAECGMPPYEGGSGWHPAFELRNRAHPARQAVDLLERLRLLRAMLGCERLALGEGKWTWAVREPTPFLSLVAQAFGTADVLGRFEAELEHEPDALRGQILAASAAKGGAGRRRARLNGAKLTTEERVVLWRKALAPHLGPDGAPRRGAVFKVAGELARTFGTSPRRERRFFYESREAILNRR